MSKSWQRNGSRLYLIDGSQNLPVLDNKVYKVSVSMSGFFVEEAMDKFTFDFKIYGLERTFINRVVKTFNNTTGNLGILMNGLKGTGKTVTAKVLCNELNRPVILITQKFEGLMEFLASIPQDIIILIDEFEKIFGEDPDANDGENNRSNTSILSIMDGVLKCEGRKIFIFTSNERWLNRNLLNRPGRLRYLKEFGDLNLSQIEEIIEDLLVDKKFKNGIIAYLKMLEIITVDIVKAVITEVNIHQEEAFDCCKDLNIKVKDEEFDVIDVTDKDKEEYVEKGISVDRIHSFLEDSSWDNKCEYLGREYWTIVGEPDREKGLFPVKNKKGNRKIFKIKKVEIFHNAFAH